MELAWVQQNKGIMPVMRRNSSLHKANQRRPPRPLLLLATGALVGLAAILGQNGSSSTFVPCPQSATAERLRTMAAEHTAEASRRVLLAGLVAAPMPAEALFGLFEGPPPFTVYTVQDALNISFPKEYEVIQRKPDGIVLKGDRVQPNEVMTVFVRPANASTLNVSIGTNITEVGERIAEKGQTVLVEAKVDPFEKGLDGYQFEFRNDQLHELWLLSIIKRGKEDLYVNVALRTPALLWPDRQETFRRIMETIVPLQNETTPKTASA